MASFLNDVQVALKRYKINSKVTSNSIFANNTEFTYSELEHYTPHFAAEYIEFVLAL